VLRRSVELTAESGQTRVRLDCPLSANCDKKRKWKDRLAAANLTPILMF
jgi:hypothetical protein